MKSKKKIEEGISYEIGSDDWKQTAYSQTNIEFRLMAKDGKPKATVSFLAKDTGLQVTIYETGGTVTGFNLTKDEQNSLQIFLERLN